MNHAGFQIKDVGYEDIRGCAALVIAAIVFTMYLHNAAKYGTFNHKKWPNQ